MAHFTNLPPSPLRFHFPLLARVATLSLWRGVVLGIGCLGLWSRAWAVAVENRPTSTEAAAANGATIFINEYRVDGARKLPQRAIEEAVYPFLGPGRTKEDVEQARAALEQAYHDRGFQTVAVQVPEQQVKRGIIHLQVVERMVGRLRSPRAP